MTERTDSRGAFSKGYVPFAALVSLYTIVIVPLSIFRPYRQEFAASFGEVATYLAGAVVFLSLAILLAIIPGHLRGWAGRALLGVVVACWYNLNFLDYRGRPIGVDVDVVAGRYAPYEYLLFLALSAAISCRGMSSSPIAW